MVPRSPVRTAAARTCPAADRAACPPLAACCLQLPQQRCRLAQLPTPIHPWPVPGLPPGVELHIKRDDLTGMELSGNKVRKLEFLLAEAMQRGHDSVITIGGIQSNHARATAVAARYLGLPCHLILRNSRHLADSGERASGRRLAVQCRHAREATCSVAPALLATCWLQTPALLATCWWSV